MSDRTPPGEGVGTKPGAIEQMLRDAKEALKMDVAFVSEFEGSARLPGDRGERRVLRVAKRRKLPLDESYCKRMLDGRIPEVVPDARGEDATRELRVSSEADIGSYCAVALVLSDGQPYETLCCVSHA